MFAVVNKDERCGDYMGVEEVNKKFPCGQCKHGVGDDDNGILCENCEVWYHTGCEKVGKELYVALQKNRDQPFFCRQFKPKVRNAIKENRELKKEMSEFIKQLSDFKRERIKELSTNIKESIQELKSDMINEVKNKVIEELKEEKEMEEKKTTWSYIIYQKLAEMNVNRKTKKPTYAITCLTRN